jgi:hypothetical protein
MRQLNAIADTNSLPAHRSLASGETPTQIGAVRFF